MQSVNKEQLQRYRNEFDLALTPKPYSTLELRHWKLWDERFFRAGKHSLSSHRFFVVLESGGEVVNHITGAEHELQQMFVTRFVADFGISPNTLLMNELLAVTEHELINSELSIREIAKKLKFSSQSYFSIFFRRMKGISPIHFRAMRRHDSERLQQI